MAWDTPAAPAACPMQLTLDASRVRWDGRSPSCVIAMPAESPVRHPGLADTSPAGSRASAGGRPRRLAIRLATPISEDQPLSRATLLIGEIEKKKKKV
jgi:hypothetical protein